MKVEINTPLPIDQIDFRIQSINKGKYATILAYKDSRVDMNRLDEVFGIFGWQKKYDLINGNLFCSVGIWHKETNQWIWKQDVGTESMADKEKGEASDAFKRACFNLGIGRELYEYPIISVLLNDSEVMQSGDTFKASWNLKLKEWKWQSEFTEGKLSKLVGVDNHGKERFKYILGAKPENKKTPEEPKQDLNPKGNPKVKLVLATPKYVELAGKLMSKEITIEAIKDYYSLSEEVETALKANIK